MGSSGTDVRDMQRKLIALGYSCGAAGADGSFGQGTYNAVCNFQRDHGLSVDGIIGPATRAKINTAYSNIGSGSAGSNLSMGSSGTDVRDMQRKLIALGYSCGAAGADGVFGQGTYDAVCRFQSNLSMGSSGTDVRDMQRKLIALGYSCGAAGADGVFGQGTYDAVCRFQRAYGLSVDGIIGPATRAKINSLYSRPATRAKINSLYSRL